MNYSRSDYLWLTSGEAEMVAYGNVDWVDLNGSWRTTLPVASGSYPIDAIRLHMKIPRGKPSEPSVVLIVEGSRMKRVDINGVHRGRRTTHIQWSATPDGDEQYEDAPEWFFPLNLSDTVSVEEYRRIFIDGAKVLDVDVQAVVWSDPPEAR